MKNGKIIIITLMCVILLSVCENISETPDIQRPLESEYGRISVSLTGEKMAARTIMPEIEFDKYVYTFTKEGEETGVEETPDEEGFFTLGVGSYTVAVQAFVGEEEPYTLAASGMSEQFDIGPGNNEAVEILLSGVDTTAQGEFRYTVTFPADTIAEISIQKLPDLKDITLDPVNVSDGNGKTQMLQLESGSYLLTVLVNKNDLYAGINEVVHINSLLPTIYTKTFTDEDFLLTQYTVTFDINEATSGTAPDARTISSGSSIALPDGSEFTREGYVFDGWSTAADGTGIGYNTADSYMVTENATLYAKWNMLYTVTFDVNEGTGTAPASQAVVLDSVITIPGGSGLSRTDYMFGGWNANADGTGDNYDANTDYTVTNNITLYAKWNIITSSDNSIVYYWIDQHGNLATTGETIIEVNETLTITAQDIGFEVKQWRLNGVDTGQNDTTYNFSSPPIEGKHIIGLFVEMNGKLYNTNITITVIPITVARTVRIDMYDSYGDGWNHDGALGINVNGRAVTSTRVNSGSKYNTYSFSVVTGDIVNIIWIGTTGDYHSENAFIMYYTDNSPDPQFSSGNNAPSSWNGSNALLFRVINSLSNANLNQSLGSFSVQ